MTERYIENPENLFDVISGIRGGQFVTVGYISAVALNIPNKREFRNPETKRINHADDYEAFGKEHLGKERVGGIVKLTTYTFNWRSPDLVKKNYIQYKKDLEALNGEFGIPTGSKEGYTKKLNFGKGGARVYGGDNDELKGHSYTPQNMFGAKKSSQYYAVDVDGNVIDEEISLDALKPFLKGASAAAGVNALRKLGAEESKINEYIKRLADLKMEYKNFEHSSILFIVATSDDVRTIYINKSIRKDFKSLDPELNADFFIDKIKEKYKKAFSEVPTTDVVPLNEGHIRAMVDKAVRTIIREIQ